MGESYATHKTDFNKQWLLNRPAITSISIPRTLLRLNQVERWFAAHPSGIKRRSHTSVGALTDAIEDFVRTHNEHSRPRMWQKTSEEILPGIERFAISTIKAHV
jgi:hypothetical protein